MAKPHKKGPKTTVDVICSNCKQKIFKYRKGGKGALIKCFKERIIKDYTSNQLLCPNCDQQFARDVLIRGTPALKIIGNKVLCK